MSGIEILGVSLTLSFQTAEEEQRIKNTVRNLNKRTGWLVADYGACEESSGAGIVTICREDGKCPNVLGVQQMVHTFTSMLLDVRTPAEIAIDRKLIKEAANFDKKPKR